MKRPAAAFAALALSLSSAAAQDAAKFEVAGHAFTPAEGWEKQEVASRMRAAQFKVGEGAEMVVFYFGEGQGGGADANVARWYGQFKEPKEELGATSETAEVGEIKVTTVSAKGTYLSGPPFGEKTPMPGYALRGAIVDCPRGPIFFKLTGPEAEVAAAAEGFDAAVRSAFE